MKRLPILYKATILSLLLTLFIFRVAGAATITVDGNPSDWPAGSSVITDPQDVTTPFADPGVDISEVFFTNDSSFLYWRFDTYGTPTRWTPVSGFYPYVIICMNTDNQPTGQTISQCNNQAGVDYYVRVEDRDFNGTPDPVLYDCTAGPCTPTASTSSVASQNNVTEVSVQLSNLGITGPCNSGSECGIPSALYFDNLDAPVDDRVPDSGLITPTIPGPTAITLLSANTDLTQEFPPIIIAIAVVAGVAILPTLFTAKQRGIN